MDKKQDLFEKFTDETARWLTKVSGVDDSIAKLKGIASVLGNDVFAMHPVLRTLVARQNVVRHFSPPLVIAVTRFPSSNKEVPS
jgi:hypothetical protein